MKDDNGHQWVFFEDLKLLFKQVSSSRLLLCHQFFSPPRFSGHHFCTFDTTCGFARHGATKIEVFCR
jgi:hypothetical protein